MNERTSEAGLYWEELMEGASPKRAATLERLRHTCDTLAARGEAMTLKAIEREIVSKHGKGAGPKAQSLANAAGAPLRRYVDLREAERAAADHGTAKPPKALGTLLKSVADDPVLVSKVLDLESELKRTKDELKRAKALLAAGNPGIDLKALLTAGSKSAPQAPLLPSEPPKCLKELVGTLSNTARLDAVGLTRDENGRIRRKTGTGDEFLSPRLVSELERLAGKA